MKAAVIGFGHIGRRHATIINEFEGVDLVGIVDISKTIVNHELFPSNVSYYKTLDELFKHEKVEILHICTPNGLHCEHALIGLNNKCHIVVEKPMGLNKIECERVLYKSLQVHRNVFVVKQNRYSPPSRWLKKIVKEKIIGDICMVQISCYWNRDDRYYKPISTGGPQGWKGTLNLDGGTLFTQFSHFIDIMYWIFGDITDIKSIFSDYSHHNSTEFEDSGIISFNFVDGGIGSLNFSTSIWNKNMESSIIVIGTKGSVKIGGQYFNEIEYCEIEDYQLEKLEKTNPPNDYGPFKGSAANHHYVVENVINTLNGKDQITANALEGMKVVDIIERIYNSSKRPIKTFHEK